MSITEDHKKAQVYELGYLILPSIPEDKLTDVVNALKGIIKKVGGTELASEDPIKFDLAYTMSKVVGTNKYVVDEAFIGWVKFETEPSLIAEIGEAVKKLDEVLRFLLVKTTKENTFTFAEALKKQEEKEAEKTSGEAPEAPVEKVIE